MKGLRFSEWLDWQGKEEKTETWNTISAQGMYKREACGSLEPMQPVLTATWTWLLDSGPWSRKCRGGDAAFRAAGDLVKLSSNLAPFFLLLLSLSPTLLAPLSLAHSGQQCPPSTGLIKWKISKETGSWRQERSGKQMPKHWDVENHTRHEEGKKGVWWQRMQVGTCHLMEKKPKWLRDCELLSHPNNFVWSYILC